MLWVGSTVGLRNYSQGGSAVIQESRLYLLRPVALDTETRGGWEMWGFSEVCFELIYGGI